MTYVTIGREKGSRAQIGTDVEERGGPFLNRDRRSLGYLIEYIRLILFLNDAASDPGSSITSWVSLIVVRGCVNH